MKTKCNSTNVLVCMPPGLQPLKSLFRKNKDTSRLGKINYAHAIEFF